MIIKDLFNGNKALEKNYAEESVGHNALAGGFHGQRQWKDYYPNCDFPKSILNSTFDCNGAREPYVLATENDTLNGVSMLFSKLLTGRAQIFADVRTYWSSESVKRVIGYDVELAGVFIHLINSGADLITLCSMQRIPVEMHNVDDKDVYRPACWNAFGQDKEGQDFRACKNYSPLFKK